MNILQKLTNKEERDGDIEKKRRTYISNRKPTKRVDRANHLMSKQLKMKVSNMF